MKLQNAIRAAWAWTRESGFSWAVCAALFVSDAGATSTVWKARQANNREWLGWVIAFALDAAAGLSLERLAHAGKRLHKVYAGLVFAVACIMPCWFGTVYYRANGAGDPLPLSIAMGSIAPALAGMIALLRGFTTSHKAQVAQEQAQADAEARRADHMELQKYRIEQEQETARVAAEAEAMAEAERMKHEASIARAEARKRKAELADAERQRKAEERQREAEARQIEAERKADKQRLIAELGKSGQVLCLYEDDPTLTQADIGQKLGITRQTVAYHIEKLEGLGLLGNGNGKDD